MSPQVMLMLGLMFLFSPGFCSSSDENICTKECVTQGYCTNRLQAAKCLSTCKAEKYPAVKENCAPPDHPVIPPAQCPFWDQPYSKCSEGLSVHLDMHESAPWQVREHPAPGEQTGHG